MQGIGPGQLRSLLTGPNKPAVNWGLAWRLNGRRDLVGPAYRRPATGGKDRVLDSYLGFPDAARAAPSITSATTFGWVMKTAWLAGTSVTFAPMRFAICWSIR